MVILFGSKDYFDHLGYIIMKCPDCKKQRIFSVRQERKKVTVYFVPTFQYSSRQILTCTSCNHTYEADEELKSEIAKNILSQKELNSLKYQGKLKGLIGRKDSGKYYCSKCQSKIKKDMLYCPQCGESLS